MNKNSLIIGVTGNIASGKSTVARELKKRGAVVVDADQLARDVVDVGTKTLGTLVGEFGKEILKSDGSLDRDRLGQMVFADTKVRATLERIVHPEIARRSVELLQSFRWWFTKRHCCTKLVQKAGLIKFWWFVLTRKNS